jgi:hypothetical protein
MHAVGRIGEDARGEQRWRRSFRFIVYWAKGKAVISIETIQGNRVQAVALELILKKIRGIERGSNFVLSV